MINWLTNWLRNNPLFLLLVIAPTCLAIVYYGLIAADVYVSESRFVVHAQQQESQSPLAALIKGHAGGDEANSVHDYILSRDALQEIEKQYSVRHAYSRDVGGFLDGFPGLSWDQSLEKFYRYYMKHVVVEADPVSSISVLTVRAFTAEDAYRINSLLLELSERLVNSLNERSRQDLIRFAAEEVQMASDKATEASLALLRYRNKQAVFQPEQQATLQLAGVAKIQEELVATEAQIAQIGQLSPNNPQIRALNSRAEALRSSMAAEAAKVTSADGSFSARSPEFTRLTLEAGFADKQLGFALAELEKARSEARQKQVYLERVVQPGKPDKAMQPRRIRGIFTVLIVSVITWLMGHLLIASVREHAD
jgi:capsular polysaccharide transport system permease protein